MKFVELFAGIGGFSLGFENAGLNCIGHCEIDTYAQKVLKKHWPKIPLWDDVTKLKPEQLGKPDIICGGFPCQDLSVAGKKEGINGKQSGLFEEIIRLCRSARPKYIVLENVRNLSSKQEWFEKVLSKLCEIGYDAEWKIISASDFGAPHKRERIWIVAYPNTISKSRWGEPRIFKEGSLHEWLRTKNMENSDGLRLEEYELFKTSILKRPSSNVANTNSERKLQQKWLEQDKWRRYRNSCEENYTDTNSSGQQEQWKQVANESKFKTTQCSSWWETEPDVGRVVNGVPSRVDRLKCLGNSLIPQIAWFIGDMIVEYEKQKEDR